MLTTENLPTKSGGKNITYDGYYLFERFVNEAAAIAALKNQAEPAVIKQWFSKTKKQYRNDFRAVMENRNITNAIKKELVELLTGSTWAHAKKRFNLNE